MSGAPYDCLEKDFRKYQRREFALQLFCAGACGFIAGFGVGVGFGLMLGLAAS